MSLVVAALLTALVILTLLFSALVIAGMVFNWWGIFLNKVHILSVWLAVVFLLLAVVTDLYRREFLPDELIHKKRRPKIVPHRDIK
jgi:predicted membrane protein